MQRVDMQTAYVLHTRPFRDTSVIVDFFSKHHGRVSAVARGARTQRSKFRGLLQAFVPLKISWSGKYELMTLRDAEPNAPPFDFSGTALISAMYLNELLVRLLGKSDPYPELFLCYDKILLQLQNSKEITTSLRQFEKLLLAELGYGVDWNCCAHTGDLIQAESWYVFVPEQGFMPAAVANNNYLAFLGAHIQSIASDDYSDLAVSRSAKQLMRVALAPLLAGKAIASRDLLV